MRSIGWLNALTDDIHMSRTLNGLAGWMNVFEQFDVLHDTILTLCMSLWPALPRSHTYATMFCTVACDVSLGETKKCNKYDVHFLVEFIY